MAILGLGRMPANTAGAFASTANRTGNSMGIDYGKLAQDDMLRNAAARGGAGGAPSGQSQAQAAWEEAMRLLQRQGPYTPDVVNQLTNRRADQTAAAEAVNAEEIRNTAAARGMDPTQALRAAQQQRQASNVAFSGDIASQAAIQNFAAETPGRMAAAQANLQRQFGGATSPAVWGGGARQVAFAPQSTGYNPGAVHQQAATMNQTWQPINLNKPRTQVAQTTAAKPVIAPSTAAQPVAFEQPIYRTPAQQSSLQNALNSKTFLTPQQASDSWSTYR